RWRIEPGELRETHLVERAADGEVQPLPDASDTAALLDFALTVARRAVGEGDRPLERIENRCGADLRRGTRELVAAVLPAGRGYEPGPLQLLQQLAHGRRRDAGLLGERGRGLYALRLARERGEQHRGVVGQPADAQHGSTS